MNYMGIDHHKQYSYITLLDEKGEKLNSGRVANLRSELEFPFCACDKSLKIFPIFHPLAY
jgi:hypothetical protein